MMEIRSSHLPGVGTRPSGKTVKGRVDMHSHIQTALKIFRRSPPLLGLSLFAMVLLSQTLTSAQASGHLIVFGDLKIDESKAHGVKPLTFDVILYSQGGVRL